MLQINGGGEGPYVIRHNTILNPGDETGCISLFYNFGPIKNVLVEQNYVSGAGYTVYGGGPKGQDTSQVSNVKVRNNVFGKDFWPNGGRWGPITNWDGTAPGNEWTNNRWTDGSLVLP